MVKVKKTNRISVRMSEWIRSSEVTTFVNGRSVEPKREGRYLAVSSLSPHDEVVFTFAVVRRKTSRVIARWPYRLTLQGSQVVEIDPPGKGYPLYREQPQGKLAVKQRFVAAKKVIW